jgi:hypothetical protein
MRRMNRRRRFAALLTVGVLPALVIGGAAAAPSASAATGCGVAYRVNSEWSGGFTGDVVVTNLGDAINGWKLTWTFPAGQTVTHMWTASSAQSGSSVTATNMSYNATIATGGSVEFGFNGSWTGSNPAPASFSLNGTTCTGGVGTGTTTTTTVTSGGTTTSTTASTTTTTRATTTTTRTTTTTTTSQASGSHACDLYAAGGTPCIAAHSTVRALFGSYNSNLYQVRRSDGTTRNIGVVSPGGAANAAAQDSFCAGSSCVVTILFDQSGHGNDLAYQGSGGAGGQDSPSSATSESLTIGGSKAYSLYINPKNSYWRNGSNSGVPKGSSPEGMYMVTSGTHVNGGCCFDYGNSETDRKADGAGAMDAIYFGTSCWFGGCSGSGPWVQADLEYGLYPGGSSKWNTNQRAFNSKFVTAMLKNNGTTRFAIKGSNAQSGSMFTLWDGSLPGGYNPMKKQGAIVLGSGGDCCATNTNQSLGTFYEGAMVSGFPSDATENAVQADIVAAGYR